MVELVHTLSKRLTYIIIKSWAVLVWQVVLGRIFLSFAEVSSTVKEFILMLPFSQRCLKSSISSILTFFLLLLFNECILLWGIWWHKDGFVLCLRNITIAGYVYYAVVEKIFLGQNLFKPVKFFLFFVSVYGNNWFIRWPIRDSATNLN